MRKLIIISSMSLAFLFLISNSLTAYEKELKSLSSAMAEKIYITGKKTIAVVDFVDLQGNITELGRFLAEEFSVNLADAGRGFEVVDRNHLKAILAEHKLYTTGLIDQQTAKKLGQIAGVDALVTGTITPFGDSVRLSVKILGTATAKVIAASSCDIPKTKAISGLIDKAIEGETRPPATDEPTRTHPTAKYRIMAQNITFELTQAKIEGDTVNCHILITNNDPADREIIMLKNIYSTPLSFVVDNFGNKYGVTEMFIGTQSSRGNNKVGQLLVSGVPTNARVFCQISPKAQKIALLEIKCMEHNREFKVQLRNILLTR